MSATRTFSILALAASAGWAVPACAQASESPTVSQELAAMRAQIQAMAARIDTLEAQLADERAKTPKASATVSTAATPPASPPAAPQAVAASVTARPDTQVSWDGAPKLSTANGWSFKPRGRLQADVAGVDAPAGIAARESLGFGSELRRAYLGFDGTMPGGFGYRVEADFAGSSVDLTDLYLTYKAGREVTITVGQHKPFSSMEDMTSDLYTSFTERAAFNSAFGFERRVGASATYSGKALLVQAGAFTDNAADLNSDKNNSYSIDGRIVFMPKIGKGQLHIGGSAHARDFNDQQATARYRARPFVHTTDLRLVDTGALSATGERSYGLELAYINHRLHVTGESQWLTVRRPGLADPTFTGGYAEIGYLLTDDTTAYRGGTYDRIRPAHPVGSGGMGAIQLNLRYDWLDLSDAAALGGRQRIVGTSLVWIPLDYVRFHLNYGRIRLRDAAIAAGTRRDYSADALTMRAQLDF